MISAHFPPSEIRARDQRQETVFAWAEAAFGGEDSSPRIRALRFVEEAIELAQAEGLSAVDVHNLTTYVFGRPIGTKDQEVGGVMITLQAYCEAVGLSVVSCEAAEVNRINAKSVEHFKRRQQEKMGAGLK